MCTETPFVVALRVLEADGALMRAKSALERAEAAVANLATRATEAQEAANCCHDPWHSSALWARATEVNSALTLWTGARETARRALDVARQSADTARGDFTAEQLKTLLFEYVEAVIQRSAESVSLTSG